jgi:hypothetical protein
MCVVQSRAEVLTQAYECSLKCWDWKMEFIYLITKDFCSNVNEPVSGEVLFSGYNYFWLIDHFRKLQTASVHCN